MASEVLRKARELIERDGWSADDTRGEYGERCIMAAIFDAVGGGEVFGTKPYRAVRELAGCGVVTWNATPGRMKSEVLKLLTRAADLAEREENP